LPYLKQIFRFITLDFRK